MASMYMRMSVDTLVNVLSVYTTHRLAVDPSAAAIYAAWEPAVTQLEAADDALEEAVRGQLRIRARRDLAALKLTNAIRAFSNRTAELGNGSRRTAVYQTYFPDGFTAVGRLSPDNLLLTARTILNRVETETDPSLKAAGAVLTEAVAAAAPILAAYRTAVVDVLTKRATLHAARIAWIGAYRRVEGELTALYPMDRALVRSYFYKRRASRRKIAPEPAGGEVEETNVVGAV